MLRTERPAAPTPRRDLMRRGALPLLLLVIASACGDDSPPEIRFERLDAARTGVEFSNTITTSEAHDFVSDAFIYNGAGVGVGDLDGDGRVDIFLAGNMVSSRLYLNRGELRFEDVTAAAGVATDRWVTGVSLVDINADGHLDIYLSVAGPEWTPPEERANLLFLNRGDGTFEEAAARFGVADTGFTTHAVFFDYDRDGDLDLFLLGNSPGEFRRGDTGMMGSGGGAGPDPAGFDRLYRNEGDGRFVDVSDEAGIVRRLGYGLGVVAADIDRDGWPDIYVSNDIAPSDVLYGNNRDGTFTDRLPEWLDQTSFAGMGIDVADFSNDGWPDILQVDMMPEALADRKVVSGNTTRSALEMMAREGYARQYNLNTLQLNRGTDPDGRVIFSEIGRMAGVSYTDWSWTALFADLDNDGWKDIYITNGYPKAVTDFDYQARNAMAVRASTGDERIRILRAQIDSLEGYRAPNYAFRNARDLTFADRSSAWGLDLEEYGYGAAVADFDDDGWLDIVVNNIDAPATIYRGGPVTAEGNRYLRLVLEGEGANRRGLGAKVSVTAGGTTGYVDHSPYRGFMSTMDDRIHFGLGRAERVDTVEVTWPDGRVQRLEGLPVDTTLTLRQADAAVPTVAAVPPAGTTLFTREDSARAPWMINDDRASQYDFSLQPLLPHEVSRVGPPLAVADVDGDGLDDLFVGGGAGQAGVLFLQQADGSFSPDSRVQPWVADSVQSDWGAHFFDADGDGLPDLYLASGGYHVAPGGLALQDRLYLNQGDGLFAPAPGALPEIRAATAAVRPADFDGDGQVDIFVGGRLVPGDYPSSERSFLLRNVGGRFVDVTDSVAPHLLDPGGMVTDAQWIDFDGDGRLDLVTVGEWMPITFHRNTGDGLVPVDPGEVGLPPTVGWWYSLAAADIDGDGAVDLVAGNLGMNHTFTARPGARTGLVAGDLDGDRQDELIFTREDGDGREYPYFGLALLGPRMDALTIRFLTYSSFAEASMREIFGDARLAAATHHQADTFASVWLRNEGGGRFEMRPLPPMAQIAPIHAIAAEDLDGDGALDLLVAGNLLHTEANIPPVAAGRGLFLRGDGRGAFQPVSPAVSGFIAPGDARTIALLRTPEGLLAVVASSGGPLRSFLVR